MGWRLYMALAVLLVLGADMRPQQPAPPEPARGDAYTETVRVLADRVMPAESGRYLVVVSDDSCTGRPLPPLPPPSPGAPARSVSGSLEEKLAANREAGLLFPGRPALPSQAIIDHLECLDRLRASLEPSRRAGRVDTFMVAIVLESYRLQRIELQARADGVHFGAWSGQVCIAGSQSAAKLTVAAVAALPSGRCLA